MSDQSLREFWTQVIDPEGIGLPEAIARELGAYTGESTTVVLDKMTGGTDAFKALWHEREVQSSDQAAVKEFYRNQFVEAYELANWHCGRSFGELPLSYARAALFAKREGLTRALDFGSGIGSGSLALSMAGCEVHSADIANELLAFVVFRMKRRGFVPRPIDLGIGGVQPPRHYFDVITCFDVLEHVPDQLEMLRQLESYLKPGGYLFANLYDDSTHPDRPMHISSAGDWLPMVRQTGMIPVWKEVEEQKIHVLRRVRGGRLKNLAASVVDRLQATR